MVTGAGKTALIVKAPEAEPLVGAWRSLLDPAAALGVPAHITVLYPFLDRQLVEASVVAELQALFAGHRAFGVQLVACRRFPGVLYLAPAPETELRALTGAVASRWPEAPPYEGRFADVIPHLTVAQGQEDGLFDTIESGISSRLPIAIHVSSVCLISFTGEAWQEERSFGLADG